MVVKGSRGGLSRFDALPVVLVLGFADSVHTARWTNMMRGRGIRFVVLPVYRAPASIEFESTRLISSSDELSRMSDQETGVFDLDAIPMSEFAEVDSRTQYTPWRPEWLANSKMIGPGHVAAVIRRLRPTIVHSMIMQFGGYVGYAAKQYMKAEFPAWLLSNWGSDIYLYRKLHDHTGRIKEIVPVLDGYHAECERDVRIAKQLGFRRFTFPVLPASGGMDFSKVRPLSSFARPSARHEILIKGYQGWAGRGLSILAAIHLAADALRGFTIRVALASGGVHETTRAIAELDNLDIRIEEYLPSHEDAILRLANARMVIGLGISDGISTTLLEAMSFGTFPIQGCDSCGDEWIEPGRTGMLVSPHDVEGVARAIRRAVTDDALVDEAAPYNRVIVENRWNAKANGEIAAQSYRKLISSVGKPRALEQLQGEIDTLHA